MVYPTPTQEAELIREGMEEYGLTQREIDNLITNTSERRVQDADLRADKALANPNLGPISKDDFDLLSQQKQQQLINAGLAPEAFGATPSKADVKEGKEVLSAGLAEVMEEGAGDPMNRTEAFKRGQMRIEDAYRSAYEREYKSNGGDAEAAHRDAMAEVSADLRANPDSYTKPFEGNLGQKRQERLESLTPFVEDPSLAETKPWANKQELDDAKEAIEKGKRMPWIYRYLANGNPKMTARQLAEQQLGLAGMTIHFLLNLQLKI